MTNNIRIFDLDKNEIDLHPKAVSLGNFDGIHRGHRKLMEKNINLSKQFGLIPSVLLFKENTKNILNGEREYLTSLEDKIEILSDLGIKCFCLLDFNEKFKNLSPEEFVLSRTFGRYTVISNRYLCLCAYTNSVTGLPCYSLFDPEDIYKTEDTNKKDE